MVGSLFRVGVEHWPDKNRSSTEQLRQVHGADMNLGEARRLVWIGSCCAGPRAASYAP
jgi:hypothetical protein